MLKKRWVTKFRWVASKGIVGSIRGRDSIEILSGRIIFYHRFVIVSDQARWFHTKCHKKLIVFLPGKYLVSWTGNKFVQHPFFLLKIHFLTRYQRISWLNKDHFTNPFPHEIKLKEYQVIEVNLRFHVNIIIIGDPFARYETYRRHRYASSKTDKRHAWSEIDMPHWRPTSPSRPIGDQHAFGVQTEFKHIYLNTLFAWFY